MNIAIYNQIRSSGLNMTSPAVDVGNQAILAVNQADQALQPLEALGVIDTGILQSTKQSLQLANSSVTGSVSHIAGTAGDALRLSSMAQQVNKLDALSNAVPSSCFNTEALFSSVNGGCDEMFNGIGNIAGGISKKVADYIAGSISTSELEAYLSGVGADLQSGMDDLTNRLTSELELLTDLKDKIQSSSLAQSIESLWNNPCTKSVLDTTLPPDIKALL